MIFLVGQHLALLRWVWPRERCNGAAEFLATSVWLQAIHLHGMPANTALRTWYSRAAILVHHG